MNSYCLLLFVISELLELPSLTVTLSHDCHAVTVMLIDFSSLTGKWDEYHQQNDSQKHLAHPRNKNICHFHLINRSDRYIQWHLSI